MRSATALRSQIEARLSERIPSALTPAPKTVREAAPTGVATLDELLHGGLPVGALTEIVGAECSGRTALALSFVAQVTQAEKVCAWVDVSDALSPESAAASGVDLKRLLWVRCGVVFPNTLAAAAQRGFALPEKYLAPPQATKGLHGGGFGPHPRSEEKGLPEGVGGLLRPDAIAARCAEPQPRIPVGREAFEQVSLPRLSRPNPAVSPRTPWSRIDQALRSADLLLQAGGFSAIVLDMGSIAAEHVSRIPLATWFRYRAAAERTHASVLLLTQHPCAKSSAGLALRLEAGSLALETTVLAGLAHRVEVSRQRFAQPSSNVVPLRKLPQRETGAGWQSRTAWAGRR